MSITSLEEIANSALVKIGARPILSLTEGSIEAERCSKRMDPIRKIILRRHPWNFAIGRRTLAPSVDVPEFEYSYKFLLPADCLRLLEVMDEVEFRLEGGYILSDESSLSIKYIRDVIDTNLFESLFAEAMACYLAWDISYPLTSNATLKDEMWKAYRLALREAKSVDAQEDPGPAEEDGFLESRV